MVWLIAKVYRVNVILNVSFIKRKYVEKTRQLGKEGGHDVLW